MEIEAIRPLFRFYHIEDVLPLVNKYLIIGQDEYKRHYKNVELFLLKSDDYHLITTFHYFGNYFTKSEKRYILETLSQYLDKNISVISGYKVLYNQKLRYFAFLECRNYKGTKYLDESKKNLRLSFRFIKAVFYHGYKSFYHNFHSICKLIYGEKRYKNKYYSLNRMYRRYLNDETLNLHVENFEYALSCSHFYDYDMNENTILTQ